MSKPNAIAQTDDFEFAALAEAKNYRRALLSEFSEALNGKVIEVGCGIGQMTAHFRELSQITRLLSVEPESAYCEIHRQRFSGHELLEGVISDVPNSGWNAIVSINVLEHIEDDLGELRQFHSLLQAANGRLCLFVPARPEIYAPIDKDFGHYRRYTKEELQSKLVSAGFRISQLHYFNSLGYLAWWVNFCLLRKRVFEASKVRFYDGVVFPWVHLAESKLWRPPVGQSLLTVAQAE